MKMNTYLVQSSEKIKWGYIIRIIILFIILPPFIGLPLMVSLIWKTKNPKLSDYIL